jgi:ABC-type multidrug transport system fused ATPase/permease subunit
MSKDASGIWTEQRLRVLGAAVVATLGAHMVLLPHTMTESVASVSIVYALSLGFSLQTVSTFLVQVEGVFSSVERIQEFSENLEQEPSWAMLSDTAVRQSAWSDKGCDLVFDCVSVRYLPHLPRALDNVSFRIEPREKIGIVGRTGSGKSTIMGILFRLFKLEAGRIMLGGVDTTSVGIGLLRRQITIVPQDPILFSGELRKNLDPMGILTDTDLWQALKRCGLDKQIESLDGQLGAAVSEGGINFSVGERQVLCLARALLRDPRMLCLDEATANVDPTNDQRIQRVLSQEVSQCLVLTIAHRLHTVMQSDRIMVLDRGRLSQFDSPQILLTQPGIFQDLASQVGINPKDISTVVSI